MKVFISYSHDSPEHDDRVLALADRLIVQGIECIIDRDIESPPEGWPLWMERHIETADYILVVCTETYKRRAKREEPLGVGGGVKWESLLIYQDLYDADSLNTKFIPVLFDSTDEPHIPKPLRGATHYRVDSDEGYKKLYRRITKQPARVKPIPGQVVEMPPEHLKQSPASIWNVPFERNVFFTGRDKELEELRQTLAQQNEAALSQTQAIYGLGGIGKTQMAVEYAYKHKEEYRAVLWMRADTEQSIITAYAEAARLLDLPEKNAEKIDETVLALKRWLEREEDWLLIFDNADKPTLLKPYKPLNAKGHILITSRVQNFDSIGVKKAIELREMLPEDAVSFLLDRGGRNEDDVQEREAASRLAKELGYLPLALEQAGAYIKERKAKIQDYLISYEKRRLKLLNKARPVTGDYPESVATTWSMNFEEVKSESKAAIELLRLSAFLSPDSIPFELITRGRLDLGEELASVLVEVGNEPLIFSELLAPLVRYSLIRIDEEGRAYSIHRMIQEVLKSEVEEGRKREYEERVVCAVNRVFPAGSYGTWAECERLLDQGKTAAELISKWKLETQEAGRLLNAMGVYYSERGQYDEAEQLLNHSLIVYEKVLGEDDLYLATSINNLGVLYFNRGKYAEAESRYSRAMKIWEKRWGENHPDVAQSLNNLGLLYNNQSLFAKAEPLFNRALQIRESELGEDHPEVAASLSNLGLLYYNQGRFEKAEPFFNRALRIRRQAFGDDHPYVAASLHNLASLYRNQGRYEEAESLHYRVLQIREQLLGEDHPEVSNSLNNLAMLYRDQGRYEEAEPLFERALRIQQQVKGNDHPEVATTLSNLAVLYRDQRRYAEAKPLLNRAVRIFEKALGENHPEVAHSLNDLAALYYEQGQYTDAEPLLIRALHIQEALFGEEHCDITLALNNLAGLYYKQGRYAEAEALINRALLILEKDLGEEHPDFTNTLKNYATLLRSMERRAEAEEIEGRAKATGDKRAQSNLPS